MVLSEKLAALRKEHGYSQLYVAERLNVSRQAISRWEVGSSVPSTENLLELSRLYGVSLDELVGHDAAEKAPTAPEHQTAAPEPTFQPQDTDVFVISKKRLCLVCAIVCLFFLCLLAIALWNAQHAQKNDDGYDTIRYEDMSNGGIPSEGQPFDLD